MSGGGTDNVNNSHYNGGIQGGLDLLLHMPFDPGSFSIPLPF